MHHIEFGQIVRDAEIANVISSVVCRHCLPEGEIEKALLKTAYSSRCERRPNKRRHEIRLFADRRRTCDSKRT
jgi:hypothetical protein